MMIRIEIVNGKVKSLEDFEDFKQANKAVEHVRMGPRMQIDLPQTSSLIYHHPLNSVASVSKLLGSSQSNPPVYRIEGLSSIAINSLTMVGVYMKKG